MTSNIRRKVRSAEKQELVVYEAHGEQEHKHSEEHDHPGPLALFREHAQFKNATQDELVNEELAYKHTKTGGE